MIKLYLYTHHDGARATFSEHEPCPGCGVEPEMRERYVREYTKEGVPEKIRVGYHCSCGTVVVDGMVEGATLGFDDTVRIRK